MKPFAYALTGSSLTLAAMGCQPPAALSPQVQPAVQKAVDYQRFLPVSRQPENSPGIPWSGSFALDTKTGQLCWTYRVVPPADRDSKPNLPDCAYLYRQPAE